MDLARSWIFLLILFLVAGCGGGGSTKVAPTESPVRLTVSWEARSRAVSGPSAALSMKTVLVGAGASGSDVVEVFNRAADPAAYTHTYRVGANIKVATYPLRVEFYAEQGARGAMVGYADAIVDLRHSPDVGTVSLTSTIKSVTLVSRARQDRLDLEETTTLVATAMDAENHVVAISFGSATFYQLSGSQAAKLNGSECQALAVGEAVFQARINGVASREYHLAVADLAPLCGEQLDQIQLAKEGWARASRKGSTDYPTTTDLVGDGSQPWMLRQFPNCPATGTYAIGNMGTLPVCSKFRHRIAATALQRAECTEHLDAIWTAKLAWQADNRKADADVPTTADLVPRYLSALPTCPSGGAYSLLRAGTRPTCTFPSHTTSWLMDARVECLRNLQDIWQRKLEWAMFEGRFQLFEGPSEADLAGGTGWQIPSCPGGGTYFVGNLSTLPACSRSMDGHILQVSEDVSQCVSVQLRVSAELKHWVGQEGLDPGFSPSLEQFVAHVGWSPECPRNGSITIGSTLTGPSCSLAIDGHRLPPVRQVFKPKPSPKGARAFP